MISVRARARTYKVDTPWRGGSAIELNSQK